ncbi:MAG: peptidoglycan-associated lipoprotein Pal [Gemmatimonadota bacterium]|nr:peptidoglycan-associated lipoprotein Pal [Gemmatimonadota bacterium]
MSSLSRLSFLVVALPLVAGACHKKPPVVAPPVVAMVPVPSPPAPPRTVEPLPPAPVVDRGGMTAAEVRKLMLDVVYFEYDSDAIRADAQASLEKRVPLLVANPGVKLRIAGNCDDRGTDEYNLALGRRRAEAVKRFLTDRGIDASRIETVSFGRERPAVQGDNEEAWSRNRRDEFTITAGGDMLKSPS